MLRLERGRFKTATTTVQLGWCPYLQDRIHSRIRIIDKTNSKRWGRHICCKQACDEAWNRCSRTIVNKEILTATAPGWGWRMTTASEYELIIITVSTTTTQQHDYHNMTTVVHSDLIGLSLTFCALQIYLLIRHEHCVMMNFTENKNFYVITIWQNCSGSSALVGRHGVKVHELELALESFAFLRRRHCLVEGKDSSSETLHSSNERVARSRAVLIEHQCQHSTLQCHISHRLFTHYKDCGSSRTTTPQVTKISQEAQLSLG